MEGAGRYLAAGGTTEVRRVNAQASLLEAEKPITIIVYGAPAPQGSKRFVGVSKKTGRGIMIESSARVRPWRQDVKAAARDAHGGAPPMDGPVTVRMVFTLPKPASSPKKRRIYAKRKPDLSKLARSTEDALTDAGVLADDARIIEYARLAKVFPLEDPESLETPGVRIEIRTVVEAASL